jgi:hypothetical protein
VYSRNIGETYVQSSTKRRDIPGLCRYPDHMSRNSISLLTGRGTDSSHVSLPNWHFFVMNVGSACIYYILILYRILYYFVSILGSNCKREGNKGYAREWWRLI